MSSILNPNLRGFFETPGIRNYVLHGGRASSKTMHTAGFCVYLAANYRVKFLCVRRFQARIQDSVKSVIEHQIYAAGLQDEFDITDSEIRHKHTGATFSFLGLERNLREIKGFFGAQVLWVEEGEALSAEQWEVLEPTIREEGSVVFLVFNPHYISDFIWKNFVVNPPPKTLIRGIQYDENPYLSQTMLDVIEAAKSRDFELYEHIYLGKPLADDEMSIIKRKWLDAAIDGHKALGIEISGSRVTGFDVADSGEDACAYVDVHGVLAYNSDLWKAGEDELKKSATRVYARAREIGSEIVYDAIGVGAHVGSDINDLNTDNRTKVQHSKFFAGSGVYKPDAIYGETGITNKDYFSNVKSQAWWMIADRLRNTYNAVKNGAKYDVEDMLFIASDMPNLEKLKDELCTPRKDFDASGKVKVESKKDLAKPSREGGAQPSPNLADAFVMANVAPYVRSRSWFG